MHRNMHMWHTVGMVALVGLALAVLGSSCSARPGPLTGALRASNPPENAQLQTALSELDALPTPQGVDDDLMQSLKQALATALAKNAKKQVDAAWPAYSDPHESLLDLDYDNDANVLRWKYNNIGDYNLDGTVNVPDLIPLAVHFGAVLGDGIGDDGYESWILCGQSHGDIDITCLPLIGMYYRTCIAEYVVLTAGSLRPSDLVTGVHEIATIPQDRRLLGWPPRYEFYLPLTTERFVGLREVHAAGDHHSSRDYWWDTQDPYGGANGYLFTDPRTGEQSYVFLGRVRVKFRMTYDDPRVDTFVQAEDLEVVEYRGDFHTLGVYVPAEQTIEDAVLNWPGEYPDLISTVEPVPFSTGGLD
jgi:hypothetical protein